jgi:hypothetical protein
MSILRRIPILPVGVLAVVGCVYLVGAYHRGTRHSGFDDGGYNEFPRISIQQQLPTKASLPQNALLELSEKHNQAWEQLRRSGSEALFAFWIRNGLRGPDVPVAIVRVQESIPGGPQPGWRLRVEKVLRGPLPETVSAGCYATCEPVQASLHLELAQHFRPEVGRRILASFFGQGRPPLFYGVLNLDDPAEAAWLPQAVAAVNLDEDAARMGPRLYEEALTSPFPAVREVAMDRLLALESDKFFDSGADERILALIRRLLESEDANERWNAMNWLAAIASGVRDCQRPQSTLHEKPPFRLKAIRTLLAFAEKDSNVVVGDKAFEALANLDFFQKENVGRCAAIFPELRTMAYSTEDTGNCGSLNCSIVCVYPEDFREPDR